MAPTWTEDEERRILRKIDWVLMPILCVTYGVQYYDKFMLGQAVALTSYLDYSICLLSVGSFWSLGGPGHDYRDPLLLFVVNFLSRIYCPALGHPFSSYRGIQSKEWLLAFS